MATHKPSKLLPLTSQTKVTLLLTLTLNPKTKLTLERGIGLGRFGFFNFGSVWFGFQSQVLGFGFFSFGIHTPP